MFRLLSRLRRAPAPVVFDAALRPDRPVAVIGDVHGCDRLLERLLARLADHSGGDGRDIVLVGDLIDRGEQSLAVIDRVAARPELTCLMGNHEAMLIEFLEDPETRGARWLRNGGLQTLASLGIGGDLSAQALPRLRDRVAIALGDDRIDWLRARPLLWRSGNLLVVHAAADPAAAPDAQDRRHLLWGHPDFLTTPRRDGVWVAHGHTIVPEPHARDGRIPVDTGAYATGRLTAALLGDGAPVFVTA